MMTRQDGICVQCVTNGLQEKAHKQIHTTGKLYSYSQCEKQYKTLKHLKQHMNVHSSKYKCDECGKCFVSNSKLTLHRQNHSGEKPFECTVCSKRFTTSGHLVRHSRIHSGEKPYKCHECHKTFSESTQERNHTSVTSVTRRLVSPHRRETIQVSRVSQDV